MKKIQIDEYSPRAEVLSALKDNSKKYHKKNIIKNCNKDFLQDDEEIFSEALLNDIKNFLFFGDKIKSNENVILNAIKVMKERSSYNEGLKNGNNVKFLYRHFAAEIANSYKIARVILEVDKTYYQYLPERFKNDTRFVKQYLKNQFISIEYLNSRLQNDKKIISAAIDKWENLENNEKRQFLHPFHFLNEENKKNIEYIKSYLKEMKVSCYTYEYASTLQNSVKEIKKDRNIVKELLSTNGYLIQWLDKEEKTDRELVLIAISSYPAAFFCVSRKFYDDREVIMLALNDPEKTCMACPLKMIPSKYYKDRDLMKLAAKHFVDALLWADTSIRNDKEIILIALNNYHYNWSKRSTAEWDEYYYTLDYAKEIHPLSVVDEKYLTSKKEALSLILAEETSFIFLSAALRNDRDLILQLLKSTTQWKTEKENINHVDINKFTNETKVIVEWSRSDLIAMLDEYTDFDFRNDKECVIQILNCNYPIYDEYILETYQENNYYIGETLIDDDDVLKAAVQFTDKEKGFGYLGVDELFSHNYFKNNIKKLHYFRNGLMPFKDRVSECFEILGWDFLVFQNYGKNYAQAIDYLRYNYFDDDFDFDAASFMFFTEERNLWRDEPEQLMIYYQFNSQDKEGFIDTLKEYALHPVIQEGLPPRIKLSEGENDIAREEQVINAGPYVHGDKYDISKEKSKLNEEFNSAKSASHHHLLATINSSLENKNLKTNEESKFGFLQLIGSIILIKWIIIGTINLSSY